MRFNACHAAGLSCMRWPHSTPEKLVLSFYLPAGRDPDRPAIVWADEAAPEMLHSMTLGQLRGDSAHVADALRALGLQPGKVAVRPH